MSELIPPYDELPDEPAVEELPDVDGLTPVRSLDQLRQDGPAEDSGPRERLEPQAALERFWGYDTFRPNQRTAVAAALAGRDALVIMPTGGGKSLCYQLPPACGAGLTLVISPLIALMDDQVAAANQAGLRAGALHSNLDAERKRSTYAAAASGRLDLLYVSPERFMVGDLLDACRDVLGLFAIDEAHCVSHWGHDFRPEYRQLHRLLDRAPDVPRMGLTATATPQVQQDVISQLGLRDPERLIGHPDRPNLIYRALPRHQPVEQIHAVIKRHPGEGGIVYCQTRKETERIAEALRARNVDATAYHAGMPGNARARVQEAFVREHLDVVVATIAFGMGIDRSNVRYVVHANMPKSVEHYQQESGRAGRDGAPAECVLLTSTADLVLHRRLAERDRPLEPARKAALERQLGDIGRYAVAPVCRHRLLSEHFGHTLEHPEAGCGACDICLGETTVMADDVALTTAQKIISAVWRLESRFGVAHVVEVLRGSRAQKILRFRHHDLSVYGLFSTLSAHTVRAWIDQLIVQGHLAIVEHNRMPLLTMTAAGRDLCKGSGTVRLSDFPAPRSAGPQRRASSAKDAGLDPAATDLFERMRQLRRRIADEADIAPYMVFSDASLRDMALLKPRTPDEFLLCHGVGATKRERYGAAFLAVIAGMDPERATLKV
ncbi:MAG: RecQ family ATP-dependent DNA helicase [Planctomycetota bacterium]